MRMLCLVLPCHWIPVFQCFGKMSITIYNNFNAGNPSVLGRVFNDITSASVLRTSHLM